MSPARVPALALLLLASCATAPEMKRSPLAPSKSTAHGAPESKPPDQPSPKSAVVQPAVLKDPGKSNNVKPVQYEDTLSAHCRQVPMPANCVPPPSGEEVVFEVLKPPPSHTPIPWYRWLWPFGLAAAKDSDPEEAARRDRPPKPNEVRIRQDWRSPEPDADRYRPCQFRGYGGSGPFKPDKAPPAWIRCTYTCARYDVDLNDVRQKRDKDGKLMDPQTICEEWVNIKRAEEEARSFDAALKAQGR